MSSDLTCPNFLLGTGPGVAAAWKKFLRKAWKQGDWGTLLDDLAGTPYEEIDELWLSTHRYGPPATKDIVWRPNVVGITMRMFPPRKRHCTLPHNECAKTEHDCVDKQLAREDLRIFHRLTLTGMSHLWFTLGQLYSGFGSFWWHGRSWPANGLGDYQESLLSYFSALTRWLHELQRLELKYRSDCRPQPPDPLNEKSFYTWHWPYRAILYQLGWPIQNTESHIYSSKRVINYMLAHDIIRRDESGVFHVHQPIPSEAQREQQRREEEERMKPYRS
jgi:hypothetical protein